jgi:rod shape-determining protein MreB and related proteins
VTRCAPTWRTSAVNARSSRPERQQHSARTGAILRQIVRAVRDALERPPELSADIYDRGVVLTGGGAMLRNLDRRLATETSLPVLIAENPLTSVVTGAGMILSDLPLLRKVVS